MRSTNMKLITQAGIKKASAGTLAEGKELQGKSYQGIITLSTENLKEQIGELLFCLELPVGKELCQIGWSLFKILLLQYIEATHQEAKNERG